MFVNYLEIHFQSNYNQSLPYFKPTASSLIPTTKNSKQKNPELQANQQFYKEKKGVKDSKKMWFQPLPISKQTTTLIIPTKETNTQQSLHFKRAFANSEAWVFNQTPKSPHSHFYSSTKHQFLITHQPKTQKHWIPKSQTTEMKATIWLNKEKIII